MDTLELIQMIAKLDAAEAIIKGLTKERDDLKVHNEVLYRDNVTLSETADRLRDAASVGLHLVLHWERYRNAQDAMPSETKVAKKIAFARAALEVGK